MWCCSLDKTPSTLNMQVLRVHTALSLYCSVKHIPEHAYMEAINTSILYVGVMKNEMHFTHGPPVDQEASRQHLSLKVRDSILAPDAYFSLICGECRKNTLFILISRKRSRGSRRNSTRVADKHRRWKLISVGIAGPNARYKNIQARTGVGITTTVTVTLGPQTVQNRVILMWYYVPQQLTIRINSTGRRYWWNIHGLHALQMVSCKYDVAVADAGGGSRRSSKLNGVVELMYALLSV